MRKALGLVPIRDTADIQVCKKLVDCTIDGNVKVSDTITKLEVIGCEVKAPITAACTSSFNITFDQNVIKNNASSSLNREIR